MIQFLSFLLAGLTGFSLSLALAPVVIWTAKKLKFGQNIYHYVEGHAQKQGTPTMGGFIFLLGTTLGFFIVRTSDSRLALVCLSVFFAYGLLGFLDDFLKVKRHKNEGGLKPWQKIIGQLAIAGIVAYFTYTSNFVGAEVILPFVKRNLNLGFMIIPFIILVFLATTNSVNLTDGLDGLAGGVSAAYLLGFAGVLGLEIALQVKVGASAQSVAELTNILLLVFVLFGALLAYLTFNSHPAKIFMGDTGSLALGGFIAAAAVLTRLSLFILFLGFMFVVSSVSVMIQVLYYKRTKKRVFLMAPLHHHFEKKGVHENKIVAIYIIATGVAAAAIVCLQGLATV